MINRLTLGSIGEPITDHWFGEFGGAPMPRLLDGSQLVNLVSLDTTKIPGFEHGVPPRLCFPFSIDSDYGIDDANFMRWDGKTFTLLTNSDAPSYGPSLPLPPRPLTLIPVTAEQAATASPRWFVGDHPISAYFENQFTQNCIICHGPMRFILQLESGGTESPFCVFDGETLYYGWCSACQVLSVEAHTY